MIEAALRYLAAGMSIVPLHPTHDYYLAGIWREFAHSRPSETQILRWWADFPQADIALVPGRVSDLLVLEVDETLGAGKWRELLPQLPPTSIQRQPKSVTRVLFRWADTTTCGELWPGVKLLSDGCHPFPAYPGRGIYENGATNLEGRAEWPGLELPQPGDGPVAAGWFPREVCDLSAAREIVGSLV